MKLSVVSTLYRSSLYIVEFHKRVSNVAKDLVGDNFEIILVNDCSPDDSLQLATGICRSDSRVVVVDLAKNVGHHKAMMTGLSYAVGDMVFLIDSDLEEQPEWLPIFHEQFLREDLDSVFGVQAKRRGSILELFTSKIFYTSFRFLTRVDQPDNIVTARLMSRQYVQALVEHKERELNIGGLFLFAGFKQASQPVKKLNTSPTTYNFSRKFNHFVNAITSFSSLPLTFTFYAGLIISVTAFFYIFYLIIRYFFVSTPPEGYTSIIASTWLFSGLIIFFLGVQGIYLSKVFNEVKQRPYSIVRKVYRRKLLVK
jgi:putative glycosyltransferase